jgi:hypothetical protein
MLATEPDVEPVLEPVLEPTLEPTLEQDAEAMLEATVAQTRSAPPTSSSSAGSLHERRTPDNATST